MLKKPDPGDLTASTTLIPYILACLLTYRGGETETKERTSSDFKQY